MESEIVNDRVSANSTLDVTLELPILKAAARNKVDVYLPSPANNWQGPALQDPAPRVFNEADSSMAPKGMLRPVDTSFASTSDPKIASVNNNAIRSYARRSAKRGLVYTIIIALLLLAGGIWAAMHFESFQQAILARFQ